MSSTKTPATTVLDDLGGPTRLVFNRFELSNDEIGQRTFGQEVVRIGTARSNDVVLTDPTVSRFHCEIHTSAGRSLLVDLDSTNGTHLGPHRVERGYLQDAVEIRLGQTSLAFRPLAEQTTVDLPETDRLGGLIGTSVRMRQLYDVVARVAQAELPVVIEGETGTGKELVAHIIHEYSQRSDQSFEVLDCSALPDNLIESELFGHTKGAFTGAERDRAGVFERADGGTVFLDEIGELRLGLQPKLLRVLETGEVRRVGGDKRIQVDVRLVSATHRRIEDMVNKSQFREDLYYRLAGAKVEIPPLRDRREDIPLLVAHFLELLRDRGQSVPDALDPDSMETFMRAPWPGNVRQLRRAVERFVALGTADVSGPGTTDGNLARDDLSSMPLREARDVFERTYLEGLMRRHNNDLDQAATASEMHRKSLLRLLRKYALK